MHYLDVLLVGVVCLHCYTQGLKPHLSLIHNSDMCTREYKLWFSVIEDGFFLRKCGSKHGTQSRE